MHKTLAIMYSGGLDSFLAWKKAQLENRDPLCIFVNLGQSNADKEIVVIKKLNPDVVVLSMKELVPLIERRMNNQIIPSRNVLLAVIGSMFAEEVWINALDGEQNGAEHDKSKRFFDDTSGLLSFTNHKFQPDTMITSPFSKMSKVETIKWGLDNNVPIEDMIATSSCYDSEHNKCGVCLTCYKRYTAFLINDIEEPGYDMPPLESAYADEMNHEIPKALASLDFSRFSPKRCFEWILLHLTYDGTFIKP